MSKIEIDYADGRHIDNATEDMVKDSTLRFLAEMAELVKAGKTTAMAVYYILNDEAKTMVMVDRVNGLKLAGVIARTAIHCECGNPGCITHIVRDNFVNNVQQLLQMDIGDQPLKRPRMPGETVQ